MKKVYLLLASITLVTSCNKEESKTKEPIAFAYNNGEVDEWTPSYSLKKSAQAHSGTMVGFVDSATMYSIGYLKSLENISKTKIDSVVFSYWVFLKDNQAKAKTVMSIDKPDNSKNIVWIGNPIEDKIKEYNKWMFVKESFPLPPNIDSENILKLYVWNTSKKEILLDDFKIEFY